jgi:hypothetical protein
MIAAVFMKLTEADLDPFFMSQGWGGADQFVEKCQQSGHPEITRAWLIGKYMEPGEWIDDPGGPGDTPVEPITALNYLDGQFGLWLQIHSFECPVRDGLAWLNREQLRKLT